MDNETLVGTTVGFILAFAFLTHILMEYEKFMDEKKLATGFGFGFLSAVVAYLVEQLGIFGFTSDPYFSFYSIFGIAVVHTALKGMSLNHHRFTEGKDPNIAFYGAYYGFTFGAVYVTVIISKVLKGGEMGGHTEPYIIIPMLFFLSLGMILFQGSTSLIMGYGVSQGKVFTYFRNISVIHIFMNIFFFLNVLYNYLLPLTTALVLVFGTFLYMYSYRVILPLSLTKEQKKEMFPTLRPIGKQLSRKSLSKQSSSSPTSSPDSSQAAPSSSSSSASSTSLSSTKTSPASSSSPESSPEPSSSSSTDTTSSSPQSESEDPLTGENGSDQNITTEN